MTEAVFLWLMIALVFLVVLFQIFLAVAIWIMYINYLRMFRDRVEKFLASKEKQTG